VSGLAIILNGDPTEVEAPLTVADLLVNRAVRPERVVVEHNRRILSAEEFATVWLAEGDELELVQFVGGG
jgi:thiamine biosynthesis protein ThiS